MVTNVATDLVIFGSNSFYTCLTSFIAIPFEFQNDDKTQFYFLILSPDLYDFEIKKDTLSIALVNDHHFE